MSENKNVIIFQDESGKKGNKWTLAKVGSAIKHFKWWVIGATVLTGVFGLLGVELLLNKQSQRLSARYVYNLATEIEEETGIERYVDGSIFNYAGVISNANLESVKGSNEKFAKINTNQIVRDNAISVVKEINYQFDENDKPIKETKSVEYTITASAKYFPNSEIGKDFIKAVISSACEDSTRAINNFSVVSYIDSSFDDSSIIQQNYLLKKQYSAIDTCYSKLIKRFGDSAFGNEQGQSLGNMYVSFKSQNSSGTSSMVDALSGALYANAYVDYEAGHETELITEITQQSMAYEQIYYSKVGDLNNLKSALETLTSTQLIQTMSEENEYIEKIIDLNEKIINLQDEVDDVIRVLNYGGYYLDKVDGKFKFDSADETNAIYHLNHLTPEWIQGCQDFVAAVNSCEDTLKNEVSKSTQAYRFAYIHYQNSASLLDTGNVQLKGGLNMFIGLAAGIILGFAVSTIICSSIEVNKKEEEVK